MGVKKRIPHVAEAEDMEDHRAAVALALEQEKHGHYRFSNLKQEDLPDGGVRISVERHETVPGHQGEPHGLWEDESHAAEPPVSIATA